MAATWSKLHEVPLRVISDQCELLYESSKYLGYAFREFKTSLGTLDGSSHQSRY